MEEKKKTTMKAQSTKNVEIKNAEVTGLSKQIDYRPFFNKIMVCLYAIIALLVFITVALLLNLKDEKTTSNTNNTTNDNTTDESGDYDVSMFEEVTMDGMLEKIKSSDIQVVYIGRSTCGYCVKFLPVLQQAQSAFGYKTLYIDITKVDQSGYDKIVALDNFFNDFGSTPMVALFKDGKFIKGTIGASEYSEFESFLKENGLTAK